MAATASAAARPAQRAAAGWSRSRAASAPPARAAVGLCEVLGNGGGNTAALALLLHAVYTLNAAQLQAKGLQIG